MEEKKLTYGVFLPLQGDVPANYNCDIENLRADL
jgi:hypothetical protein